MNWIKDFKMAKVRIEYWLKVQIGRNETGGFVSCLGRRGIFVAYSGAKGYELEYREAGRRSFYRVEKVVDMGSGKVWERSDVRHMEMEKGGIYEVVVRFLGWTHASGLK